MNLLLLLVAWPECCSSLPATTWRVKDTHRAMALGQDVVLAEDLAAVKRLSSDTQIPITWILEKDKA